MSDPRRPVGFDPTRQAAGPTEAAPVSYPPSADPAYAGQLPTYGTGYPPRHTQNSTSQWSQQHWAPGQPPPGSPADGDGSGPPKPPRPPGSPRWLFLLAGGAVLLVVVLAAALMIANGSTKSPTAVSPLPPMPSTTPPTPIPATTTPLPSPGTSTEPTTAPPTAPPTESTTAGEAQAVGYSVTGQGRAISIAYLETGGVLQTEFNVVLPWSKQVSLTPPASKSASVTVVNIGAQVTCSVTVDGTQVRQRTGTIVTICAVAG